MLDLQLTKGPAEERDRDAHKAVPLGGLLRATPSTSPQSVLPFTLTAIATTTESTRSDRLLGGLGRSVVSSGKVLSS
jgi:hypothetical protein